MMEPSATVGQNATWSNQMRRCTFTTRPLACRNRTKLSMAAFRDGSGFRIRTRRTQAGPKPSVTVDGRLFAVTRSGRR